jgi:hypothetical protein
VDVEKRLLEDAEPFAEEVRGIDSRKHLVEVLERLGIPPDYLTSSSPSAADSNIGCRRASV